MEKRRKKRRRGRSVNLDVLLFVRTLLLVTPVAATDNSLYLFSEMDVVRSIAPMFPLTLASGDPSEGIRNGRNLEDRDSLDRTKKRCRVSEMIWPIGSQSVDGATVTVVHDLVENGGICFEFVSEVSGTFHIEAELPRAPNLGAFALRIGKDSAGSLDAWAPQPEPLTWRRFPDPVNVKVGKNRIDLLQLSPTDSPLILRAFRLIPLAKGEPAGR